MEQKIVRGYRGLGVNGLDLVGSSTGVENVFGLGLEGCGFEAKEVVSGVRGVQGTSMEVDGLVDKGRRYGSTRFGVKRVGFGSFVREGQKSSGVGVGRVAWGGKRARGWGKLGFWEVNGGRWTCLEQKIVRGYRGWG